MSRTVVIHQPDFIPYLGFFQRLLHANLYVVFDHVQFLRGSKGWHKRDKIKTAQGERWISISVVKAGRETPINEVLLSGEVNWRDDHLNQFRIHYKNAAYFNEIWPFVEDLYATACEKLVDFNLRSIQVLMQLFAIEIEMLRSSALAPVGKGNELIVDIMKKVNGDVYLSGLGAKDYFDPAAYEANHLTVRWQDFKHPVYPQLYDGFIPFLTSFDLLFNCGIHKSRDILRTC